MSSSRIIVKQSDGYETILYPYLSNSSTPRGTFLILHGMAEHHARYHTFAEYLNSNNYDVFLYNHRGHGTDKKIEELGYFSSVNGYKKIINDSIMITQYIKKINRSNSIILFGHSMGSIILRNTLQYLDEIDCAIICGSTFPPPLLTKIGLLLATLEQKLKGPKHVSKFLNKLLFEGKPYRKLCSRTSFDWLTRDTATVGAYIHDPYCGNICTTRFYYDLFKLTLNASKPKIINITRKDLPILILSGDHDPVGGYGKQITKYFLLLQKLGFRNVDCTLYADCRHELLNELNRDEIMTDIIKWVSKYDSSVNSST